MKALTRYIIEGPRLLFWVVFKIGRNVVDGVNLKESDLCKSCYSKGENRPDCLLIMVIKCSSARYLDYGQLVNEYRLCAESGAIISVHCVLTPEEKLEWAHWTEQTLLYSHYWFSLYCHTHILDVVLRLNNEGHIKVARVSPTITNGPYKGTNKNQV